MEEVRQRNVSVFVVPDRRQTQSRAPETEVSRGRQEIFMMWKKTVIPKSGG